LALKFGCPMQKRCLGLGLLPPTCSTAPEPRPAHNSDDPHNTNTTIEARHHRAAARQFFLQRSPDDDRV
jgi:hypothetical protein